MPKTQMAMMMPSTAPHSMNLREWYVHASRSTVQSALIPCTPVHCVNTSSIRKYVFTEVH